MFCSEQVSTNGFISFGSEVQFNSYIVEAFPRQSNSLPPVIAPLWADFSFRDRGALFYRTTRDRDVLETVSKKLAGQNSAYSLYRPTEAVVVTWFEGSILTTESQVILIYSFLPTCILALG